ncbi:uncharacterized protein LOC119639252 [Glossina fuscipes]|uniref:Uncharacterized protein LOC119639252 n=1 Tax=Glossina fuscipes TaxID=7396 RepID=A0A9C5ZAH9_9MUSC|nr:uncharacterized protein LOC119639252 [Glossina fuscipes]
MAHLMVRLTDLHVSLSNTDSDKKEMLEYSIRSDGTCTINVSDAQMVDNMGRVMGGDFGFIEAGVSDTVSLIWPTVSLYNRVGICPVVIISTNAKNDEFHLKQLIKFDTRFDIIDPEGHTFKKHKNYKDCKNWDKDYLKNCTPVNCEERYFGLRSFYNETSEKCVEVARCADAYEVVLTYPSLSILIVIHSSISFMTILPMNASIHVSSLAKAI